LISLITSFDTSHHGADCPGLLSHRQKNIQTKTFGMKRLIFTTLLTISTVALLNAQVKYHATHTKISVAGTSTLHNWDMESEKANCDISFNFDGANITGVSSLLFTVQAESLKSDSKGLDKNAYKALKSSKYPDISFSSNFANIRSNGPNSYVISAKGKLTISGVSKEVWLAAVSTVNPSDMSIQTIGSAKFKMTEYSVEPPSFMFGAMKTGDEITVKFSVTLKK
jgi:polyisoprenoid-binding protein YceI